MTIDDPVYPLPPGVRVSVHIGCGKMVGGPAGVAVVESQRCQCHLPTGIEKRTRSRKILGTMTVPVSAQGEETYVESEIDGHGEGLD